MALCSLRLTSDPSWPEARSMVVVICLQSLGNSLPGLFVPTHPSHPPCQKHTKTVPWSLSVSMPGNGSNIGKQAYTSLFSLSYSWKFSVLHWATPFSAIGQIPVWVRHKLEILRAPHTHFSVRPIFSLRFSHKNTRLELSEEDNSVQKLLPMPGL